MLDSRPQRVEAKVETTTPENVNTIECKATVPGRNFRDIATGCPKLLLTNIVNLADNTEVRDHTWAKLNEELEKFVPHHNKHKLTITFKADLVTYNTRGTDKVTLVNLREIKICKNKKRKCK